MNGAGGSTGGIGSFFLGIIMMCIGFYMLLNSITITSGFGGGRHLYSFAAYGSNYKVTGGTILFPFIFGIGMVFFNSRNILGWILTIGSLAAFIFGVIASINFRMAHMSAFDLIVILVLAVGGMGLFLRSLKSY
ncbi:MAG: hypothetical protein GQ582_05055 [Methyloprofundus sp.]|nr:hypothetical protein [Methyloprofundus sp.]